MRRGPGTNTSVVRKAEFKKEFVVLNLSVNDLNELWYQVGDDEWFISDFSYPEKLPLQ